MDVAFADAARGWIAGSGGTILSTSDGGKSWSLQASGTNVDLQSVFALDARTAWVVGANGTVLATATGGN